MERSVFCRYFSPCGANYLQAVMVRPGLTPRKDIFTVRSFVCNGAGFSAHRHPLVVGQGLVVVVVISDQIDRRSSEAQGGDPRAPIPLVGQRPGRVRDQ